MMPGFLTNGLPMLGQVGPAMFLNVDTDLPRGTNPQSVAASAFQVAAAIGDCLLNHETIAGGAGPHSATSNTLGGYVTIGHLATDPMDEFIFELHNTLIDDWYLARGNIPEVGLYSGTNKGGLIHGCMYALMMLQSTTPVMHRVTWVFRNMGNTPLDGSMALFWHL
jgi:hypothetical protein